jgi:hypothetical protein
LKKDWKYILYLGGAILVYIVFSLTAPRQLDWRVTFHRDHTIPFGGYVLHELVHDIFPQDTVYQSNYTLYELYDTLHAPVNLLSISEQFYPGDDDVNALLKNVALGGSAFISASNFYGKFSDTLHFSTQDYFFDDAYTHYLTETDSSFLRFSNSLLPDSGRYFYPRKNLHQRIMVYSDSLDIRVTAVNDLGMPVTIAIPWGKGKIIINSTPMVFTNAYILPGDNHRFVANSLSYLPENDLLWTEFYHLGRMEAETPLRFILSTESLRWAYFITIVSLLLFIVFEAKRRQRIIPIITPVANTTLEFVSTIGDLYYQQGDHKDIAEKLITYWLEHVRTRYRMNTAVLDNTFVEVLAKKSGKSADDLKSLVMVIQLIQSKPAVALDRLADLNNRIEKFNNP